MRVVWAVESETSRITALLALGDFVEELCVELSEGVQEVNSNKAAEATMHSPSLDHHVKVISATRPVYEPASLTSIR